MPFFPLSYLQSTN